LWELKKGATMKTTHAIPERLAGTMPGKRRSRYASNFRWALMKILIIEDNYMMKERGFVVKSIPGWPVASSLKADCEKINACSCP
jgi:hypothetical protein